MALPLRPQRAMQPHLPVVVEDSPLRPRTNPSLPESEAGPPVGCTVLGTASPAGFTILEVIASIGAHAEVTPPAELAQITVVLEGALETALGMDLSKGHLIFTPPQWMHSFTTVADPTHLLLIRPQPERLQSFAPYFPQPWACAVLRLGEMGDHAHRVLRQLHHRSHAQDIALEAAVLALIAEGLEAQARKGRARESAATRKAIRYIEAHLERPMRLQSIAAAAGASRSRLVAVFRQDMGMAVGEFIRAARLRRACRRLRETDDPLKEVALACGFYDQSHMTRVFREELALTPSLYRKSPGA